MVIKRQTLTSQVIDHILEMIKTGQVKPGDRLPTEKEMTESLGVSRTCVREAIKSLESLRMIRVRPKIGAVLLELSSTALLNAEYLSRAAWLQQTDVVIEFRKLIEVGLAALAAEKATDEDLQAMEAAIVEHKKAMGTNQPAAKADIDFHAAIAAASKNPIALMVLGTISGVLSEQRRQTNDVPGAAQDGLRDHRLILAAIRGKNPDKARHAMLAHMQTADRYLRLARASSASSDNRVASAVELEESQTGKPAHLSVTTT